MEYRHIIYAPSYWGDFKCIADRCRHSCCIDWEICIDEVTYKKYQQIGDIRDTVEESEDGACFALREDGRCPHLRDDGLCNIICSHGEDYLSEICQNHPRFYNYINSQRTEAGLGIVCEEACRLILENEKPFSLSEIECLESDEIYDTDDPQNTFDPLPLRDHIISVIEGKGTLGDKLNALKREFGIPELYTKDKWLDRFLSLEILDADWERELRSMKGKFLSANKEYSSEYSRYYERLLTYFVYRHVSVADSSENLRARLAFAILSLEVIRSLFENCPLQTLESLIDWARRYSSEIEYSEDNTAELVFAFENNYTEENIK